MQKPAEQAGFCVNYGGKTPLRSKLSVPLVSFHLPSTLQSNHENRALVKVPGVYNQWCIGVLPITGEGKESTGCLGRVYFSN